MLNQTLASPSSVLPSPLLKILQSEDILGLNSIITDGWSGLCSGGLCGKSLNLLLSCLCSAGFKWWTKEKTAFYSSDLLFLPLLLLLLLAVCLQRPVNVCFLISSHKHQTHFQHLQPPSNPHSPCIISCGSCQSPRTPWHANCHGDMCVAASEGLFYGSASCCQSSEVCLQRSIQHSRPTPANAHTHIVGCRHSCRLIFNHWIWIWSQEMDPTLHSCWRLQMFFFGIKR